MELKKCNVYQLMPDLFLNKNFFGKIFSEKNFRGKSRFAGKSYFLSHKAKLVRRAPRVFIGQGRFSEARAHFLLFSNKQ